MMKGASPFGIKGQDLASGWVMARASVDSAD